MSLSKQIAKHFREVHFGGNWTSVNLQETLSDIPFDVVNKQIGTCNTIASLVFHMNYYVVAVIEVLKGLELNASDSLSYDCPIIDSEKLWQEFVKKVLADAEEFATLIEDMDPEKFNKVFSEDKYGNYYRNIHGIIEHTHYHLGQISLLKKLLT
jgi:hypothetical protein